MNTAQKFILLAGLAILGIVLYKEHQAEKAGKRIRLD